MNTFTQKSAMVIMALFFLLGRLHSQGAFTTYNLSNSGIPDNSVLGLHVHPDGALYLGTDNGLGKLEGSTWTIWRDTNSGLPENTVRSIHHSLDNALWVGTFNGGLTRFQSGIWRTWNTFNSPLPGDHVRSLSTDLKGGIWIGTTSGLARMRDSTWSTWNFVNGGGESNNTAAIATQDSEVVWCGMVNGGLIRVADTGFHDYTIHNSGLMDNTILGIALEDDDPWLATPANGITWFWNLAFLGYHPLNSGNPSFSHTCATRDAAGRLWTGTVDKGIVCYDGTNWWNFDPSNSSFPQVHVRSIVYDSAQDVIWAGTASAGLVRVDISTALGSVSPDASAGRPWTWMQPRNGGAPVLRLSGHRAEAWQLHDLQGRIQRSGTALPGDNALALDGVAQGVYVLVCAGGRGRVSYGQ